MARRRVRARKQRVVLRSKQRVELNQKIKSSLIGLVVLGVLVLGGRAVVKNSAWAPGYIQRHTPILEFKAPETLAELPLLKQAPSASFFHWLPMAEARLRKKWMQEYPAIGKVEFDKQFLNNRIVARIEPRIPLVRWEDRGIDKEGKVFTLASSKWSVLPKATFASSQSMASVGRWLAVLSGVTPLWSQVVNISQDVRGEMWLDMQTGTRVAWGPPEAGVAQEKARCLATVLNDAHTRLSGAATADVRFFEEGRVIVKPKLST